MILKPRNIFLILISLALIIFSYFSYEWSKEFVDPCCSGMCGRCPPSMWECTTVGSMALFQTLFASIIIMIAVLDELKMLEG